MFWIWISLAKSNNVFPMFVNLTKVIIHIAIEMHKFILELIWKTTRSMCDCIKAETINYPFIQAWLLACILPHL